jgi:hypothetical protein
MERAGMTVNATNFQQQGWRLWPAELAEAGGWVGQFRQMRQQALKVGERRHLQNETVRIARAKNQPAQVPEPAVRQHVARQEQKQLAQMRERANLVYAEALLARSNLRLVDPKTDSLLAATRRHQRRLHLLDRMTEEQRIKAVTENLTWREAAIEDGVLPEEAGLPASLHSQFREEELRKRFPGEMRATDAALHAHELFREVFDAVNKAVENELVASGTSVSEPTTTPEPASTWE